MPKTLQPVDASDEAVSDIRSGLGDQASVYRLATAKLRALLSEYAVKDEATVEPEAYYR